ncbi:Short-chain dehydrogenase/reductase SDR [Macleaya cordata]|uniref:Short-chain dehydrogenase/reductase SDR n=1 Tax=Macleaya cordata TaxID=56857 RepID=A0A200Q354_MACCD|nr:Short-chain dehydrogenase/reductase SDR [Macleaya cordata]
MNPLCGIRYQDLHFGQPCFQPLYQVVFHFTVHKFGSLDIMVNNAGLSSSPTPDIRHVDLSEFEKIFEVNVKGVFIGIKHAARVMIPHGKGSIVSVASVTSNMVGVGPHAYTRSKHAVVGITKNVAAELGAHGIHVNCVSLCSSY